MMKKRLTIVLALFLAACSSSSNLGIEKRTIEGAPGQPISVELVGSSEPMMMFARGRDIPQQVSFQFLVSNNSDESLTVQRIQVYQHGTAPIQLESAQHGYDAEIAPGHDQTFTVNANAKQLSQARKGDVPEIVIRADVALTNGDSYVYTFAIPISLEVQ
jgi:hypothetical protein